MPHLPQAPGEIQKFHKIDYVMFPYSRVHSISKCDMPMISGISLWRFFRCPFATRRSPSPIGVVFISSLSARSQSTRWLVNSDGTDRPSIAKSVATRSATASFEYSGYDGTIADDIARERRRRLRKLRRYPHLRDVVIDRLKASWHRSGSPVVCWRTVSA